MCERCGATATVRAPQLLITGLPGSCELSSIGEGIYLGTSARGSAWSGREHSTLVLGPSRSGKTSAFVLPNVLTAQGAVLSTSTKADVMLHTVAVRRQMGWCLLFDPSGTVEAPDGVHRVGWSPVAAAREWDEAHAVADAMVRTARGQRFGSVTSAPDGHWIERASALLAPLLHAAALEDESMRRVLRWVDRHDGSAALEILARRCGEDAVPTDVLAGIVSTDSREQSGIWSTASGVLAAYRSESALASTEPPFLDAAAFCSGRHTLYVCAPAGRQQLLAPLVVGMIGQIRDATYRRSLSGPGRAPVLFALDEVANIAPLPDLPALVTEGPGQGLLTLACLQDLSQGRARWGPEADAFLSIFGTTAVLGGIADMPTLDAISALGGEREVVSRSVSRSQGAGGVQASATESAALRRRLPPDVVARAAVGWALTIDARNRIGWVRMTPSHAGRHPLSLGLAPPCAVARRDLPVRHGRAGPSATSERRADREGRSR